MKRLLMIGIMTLAVCGFVLAQDKSPAECPKITVVGPPGITNSSETLKFKVEPDLKEFQDLRFEWAVSPRPPSSGQGTSEISIKTDYQTVQEKITATVGVTGLPSQCSNTVEKFAPIVIKAYDVLVDQFGKIPMNDPRGRIDNLLVELEGHPNQVGYVLLRYKEGTSKVTIARRIDAIKHHIFVPRKFPKNRILIFSEPSHVEDARIYGLPPGSMEISSTGLTRNSQ